MARLGGIVHAPQELGVGQRLTPVGERERRVRALGLAERVGRVRILEAVEERDSAQERLLCRGGAGVRKDDGAERVRARVVGMRRLLRPERRRREARGDHEGEEGHRFHGRHDCNSNDGRIPVPAAFCGMREPAPTRSVWMEGTPPAPDVRTLGENLSADVCVIGGGIAGLTTAYLLSQEGRSVVVVELARIGGQETSRTTAHLSDVLDEGLVELERLHGPE
ncbi:MAG: FAD-dependent oxidoreductase, partial [Candidatus Rokuibacteriota bacterium]